MLYCTALGYSKFILDMISFIILIVFSYHYWHLQEEMVYKCSLIFKLSILPLKAQMLRHYSVKLIQTKTLKVTAAKLQTELHF